MRFILFLLLALQVKGQENDRDFQASIGQLAGQLGAPGFHDREQAQARLIELVKPRKQEALPHLRRLWRTVDDPEIRVRLWGLATELFLQKKGSLFGFRFLPSDQLMIAGTRCKSILVEEVVADSPAEKVGLKVGDLIYGANDQLINPNAGLEEILTFFKLLPPDKVQELRVRRGGDDLVIQVQPGEQELTEFEKRLLKKKFLEWFSEP